MSFADFLYTILIFVGPPAIVIMIIVLCLEGNENGRR